MTYKGVDMNRISERFTVVDHPLVAHKMAHLRDEATKPAEFRQLVRELAAIETYEALRDARVEEVTVRTPLADAPCTRIPADSITVVPILRAGLGMLEGALGMVPSALVGHVGMERDEETHEAHPYYAKLPSRIVDGTALLVDPMLATGGSAIAALKYLRDAGVRDVRFLVLVAAPEGVQAVLEADPDVRIWTCALDDGLNEDAYILPGLGDAGDRIFGTL